MIYVSQLLGKNQLFDILRKVKQYIFNMVHIMVHSVNGQLMWLNSFLFVSLCIKFSVFVCSTSLDGGQMSAKVHHDIDHDINIFTDLRTVIFRYKTKSHGKRKSCSNV